MAARATWRGARRPLRRPPTAPRPRRGGAARGGWGGEAGRLLGLSAGRDGRERAAIERVEDPRRRADGVAPRPGRAVAVAVVEEDHVTRAEAARRERGDRLRRRARGP